MWKEYLRLLDNAPEEGTGPSTNSAANTGGDKEGSDIPKVSLA